ncbi:MAG: hypothetical protein J7493_17075 [Porphyrobacter sp.]|nr:hypothetical protein [Porphyrobacter sp.]
MARRSTPQFKIDDLAYPIRVKFAVPTGGLRNSSEIHAWLKAELDHLAWAWGPAQALCTQATAYYFRTLADAQRFVAAFPELELADGISLGVYTSPAKRAGSEPRVDLGHSAGPGWKGR